LQAQRRILPFFLVQHVRKEDDQNGLHQFRRLDAEPEDTDPPFGPSRGKPDDEDKDDEENSSQVDPPRVTGYDAIGIVHDDDYDDKPQRERYELFDYEIVRPAGKGACGAHKIQEADAEYHKPVYDEVPIEMVISSLIDSHLPLLPL